MPFTLDVDEYGTSHVEVWIVAYHVGRALHALEDSFTHALRTADLRGVIHVMNYAVARADCDTLAAAVRGPAAAESARAERALRAALELRQGLP